MHEPLDPEFSILKQRLARRLRYEGTSEDAVQRMTLVDLTQVLRVRVSVTVKVRVQVQSQEHRPGGIQGRRQGQVVFRGTVLVSQPDTSPTHAADGGADHHGRLGVPDRANGGTPARLTTQSSLASRC